MEQIVLIIHVLAAAGLIGFILIQQGKGAEVGASFGSGASQTLFGSQGSGSFLTRATAILATVFFVTSLTLGYLATHRIEPKGIDELLDKMQTIGDAEKDASNKKEGDIPRLPE
jgi:preprotein translocase subunit SecG